MIKWSQTAAHLKTNKIESISQGGQEADVHYNVHFERAKEEGHGSMPWEELVGEYESGPEYCRYALWNEVSEHV